MRGSEFFFFFFLFDERKRKPSLFFVPFSLPRLCLSALFTWPSSSPFRVERLLERGVGRGLGE